MQYYEGLHELGALIHSASQVVLPGGSLLISDIPLKRKGIEPFWDKIEMVLKSIAGGYFFEILQVFKKSRKEKQYAEISKRKPSLEFDFLELREFVSALGFRAEWIRKDFSIYPNRVSLRVQF